MPATEDQKAAGRAAIDEFLKEVEQILTLYYDGWRAFGLLAAEYEQTAQKIKASTRISDEELAKLTHKYVYQLASDLPEHEVAERTHQEYWEDNQHNGRNLRRLGNLCLVQIYALWERECRPTIKVHLGVLPNSDVMGDVRLLRISILHHHGVATDGLGTLVSAFREASCDLSVLGLARADHGRLIAACRIVECSQCAQHVFAVERIDVIPAN